MCTYIYLTLPDYAELRRIRPPLQAIGLRPYETSHFVIEGCLGAEEVLYGATGPGCDCGTWLGALVQVEPPSGQIELLLAYQLRRAACRQRARDWIHAFRSVVEAGATDRIGLLLWSESAGDAVDARMRFPLDDVDLDLLGRMEYQRVYEFYGTRPSPCTRAGSGAGRADLAADLQLVLRELLSPRARDRHEGGVPEGR